MKLRIVVVTPPLGVTFALQRGRFEFVPPASCTPDGLAFDFDVRVGARPDGAPNFLGPFTQGPPTARFVYINSGTSAGQSDSLWTRRAKVPLAGISHALIEKAGHDRILEARIAGTGRDGGPACASVPLLGGWTVAER